jgi:hexosaminidase
VNAGDLQPGLQVAYYEASMSSVNRLRRYSPARTGRTRTVELQGFERDERFGLVFRGYLRAPRAGVYEFMLTSDDGSDLVIGGETVIDHDGLHSATDQSGMIALEAGYHSITVRFFQGGGGKDLRLSGRLGGEAGFSTMESWFFSTP